MPAGFNHNLKHNGKIYHVQTEDSGPARPQVVSHLFLGGNIIASTKADYGGLLTGTEHDPDIVTHFMQEQHKKMLHDLINGKYDDLSARPVRPVTSKREALLDSARGVASASPSRAAPLASARPQAAAPAAVLPQPPAKVQVMPLARPAQLPVKEAVATQAARPPQSPAKAAATPAAQPPPASPPHQNEDPTAKLFGEMVSDAPLDEVILGFLLREEESKKK